MTRIRAPFLALIPACMHGTAAAGGDPWINFTNETASRLVADPAVGAFDVDEKDYAWDDVDHDGDTDLVVARKQPFATAGGRRNVLFLNEAGVLTDRTARLIPGFLDATNDRDVQLVDVNIDSWPDIVTAAVCHGCDPAGIADDSRLYINLGAPGGTWLGYGSPTVLIQGGNNLNAVAAGDVTGDGYPDLYFASAEDNFEDQLLINDGADDPGAFAVENDRLTPQMRASSFAASVAIADLNDDGWNDIVKVDGLVLTSIFYNNGTGFFAITVYLPELAFPQFATVGLLNGDGLLDIVVTDAAVDQRHLNLGNGADGLAIFGNANLPVSTDGYGGNSTISDLDGDGWNDVIIADVDVEVPGCGRISDILHNISGALVADSGTIPASALTGVFDVAAFDIDGNGTRDLVVGRCTGTQVWLAAPFISVEFAYPDGVPQVLPPGIPASFQVQITPTNAMIEPDTPALHASVNGGPFIATPLEPLGGDLYLLTLPLVECADRIEFYVTAQVTNGQSFIDPPGAPAATYAAIAAPRTAILFNDHIEGDVSGWMVLSDPSLVTGQWEQAVPDSTFVAGVGLAAPPYDATPGGTMAFVTDNAPPGSTPQAEDVDEGPTYLMSPLFDLEGTDAITTYARWAFSYFAEPEPLTVEISNDGGLSWTLVDTVENTGSSWQTASFIVSAFIAPTSQVRVRFGVCDCPNDSVTEAGIDDFRVDKIVCTPPCPWDLDESGAVDITDFLALLAAWGSDPGGPPDFDNDGSVGITDFLALLANWGNCP